MVYSNRMASILARTSSTICYGTVSLGRTFLDAMTDQGRNLFQFAFWTGLRTSELVALNREDIDWKRGVISVRHAQT